MKRRDVEQLADEAAARRGLPHDTRHWDYANAALRSEILEHVHRVLEALCNSAPPGEPREVVVDLANARSRVEGALRRLGLR